MTTSDQKMYFTDDNQFIKNGKEGPYLLTNFTCKITQELVYHDGNKTNTILVIDGILHDEEVNEKTNERVWPDGRPLPPIQVPTSEFASLGWVGDRWGMAPIIYPQPSAERDLRTAIQLASRPVKKHIYTHTGWAKKGEKRMYLTGSGAITDNGLDEDIEVQLPHELRNYKLPKPMDSRECFINSLKLVNIGPKEATWPMLLATYRAPVCACDFAIHVAGRTGTFKSEICSLFQSHFGAGMDARHLPASWSSTSNANEALAYRAKDCLMCVDDFVPVGTAYQVRNLQKSADQLIRAQGNQAGRARLTDISNMQTTFYPRGMLLSTGEDIPEGHSVRARMLIVELKPGDIESRVLTVAQNNREQYPQAMADWIQWLAGNSSHEAIKCYSQKIRDEHLTIGHARTPPIIGSLCATAQLLCEYAVDKGYLTVDQTQELYNKAKAAIVLAGNNQPQYLEAADPVTAMLETIRLLLGSNMAHAKTKNGGIPDDAEKYGWTAEKSPGQMAQYKSHGPRLGWVDTEAGEFMLDPTSLILIKKHSGGKLAITPQTLLKRMKEAGILQRCDEVRKRNTIRVTLEGHPRQVLVMNLNEVFDDADEGESEEPK